MTAYVIRYRPGTALAARFRGHSQPFEDRGEAERLIGFCPNGDDMEVIELEEEPTR